MVKGILLLALVIASTITPLSAEDAIKCWTNSESVRECGNSVPPEYSQQESETFNDLGIVIDSNKRALTKEERVEQRKIEAEKQRKIEAEKQRLNYDRVLLSTFLSEKDIFSARDRKLAIIDGNIEVTQISIGNLNRDLKIQRQKAANYERNGRKIPKATMERISSLERQLDKKMAYIRARELEKTTLKQKYAKDLRRFRQIKGLKPKTE